MKTIIPTEWLRLELEHVSGGDGWGIVEVLDDDYVRVTWPRGKSENACRAFLVWTKRLKPAIRRADPKNPDSPLVAQPFNADEMEKLKTLRAELASGKKKVVDTRIVLA